MVKRSKSIEDARLYGDAHEGIVSPSGNHSRETAMDLHNNEMGRHIGMVNLGKSDEELSVEVQKWLDRGLLLPHP